MNKDLEYDYLIVGAGLAGSMMAYRLKQAGKSVLVIDKRPHIGGNLYCEKIEDINVHKYGPHIFHTSNKMVWDFVNTLVPFNHFRYCPLASYKGRLYHLPFNMNTFYELWGTKTPAEAKAKIEAILRKERHEAQKNGEEIFKQFVVMFCTTFHLVLDVFQMQLPAVKSFQQFIVVLDINFVIF